jgi:uncharacterized protein (DUF3084 family)
VKNECDELLRASEQFQSKLESVRREREHALGERDEARQECIIAQREKDTATDQLKDVARVASRLVEENL